MSPTAEPISGPTVADIAFPDGREGLFGVRDTSTVRAALVAFALSKLSMSPHPVPVLRESGRSDSTVPPDNVIGAIRVTTLRELEADHADDPVASHLEPAPPALDAELPASQAQEQFGDHEIALVVRDGGVVGVVTRAAVDGVVTRAAVDGVVTRAAVDGAAT